MNSSEPSPKKVFLDTNILANWAAKEPKPGKRLTNRAEKCKTLLDEYTDQKLNIILQTSEWALGELVQSFIDKAIWTKFPYEGFELRELRNMKKELKLHPEEITDLNNEIDTFEDFLYELDVEMIPVKCDHKIIQNLVMRYDIETTDAIHVSTASGVSDYLITTDSTLNQAGITEIQVIDPGTLSRFPDVRRR